ncbi:DNA polymerase III subunit alpha [Brachybacterium kimchii]|uniref:DNA-directed DNA polymerase n=1 Tax=Brachybacterium kimchii TaxID=2942909 RepID=A0ABY4N8U5_9MICO|nr:DNA polymerase III subunit alpha [Brachybacterium kimchii]UQN30534.1 DNA polymerase III subunit alpha [Brachybacterium kimchii]
MSTGGFVHLHTHSEYSDFDGLSSVKRLVQAASADHQGALAITDHGRLAALWALRTACADAGDVKAIPGIEAYIVVSGTRENPGTIQVASDSDDLDAGGSSSPGKGSSTKTKKYEHLTLLASTRTGLRNLIEMSNTSQESKTGKYPLIDYELLAHHAEGLIVLTGCIGGPVAGPLSRITGEDPDADAAEAQRAQQNLDKLIAAVGRENVYVELADHGQEAQERALQGLYDLAERNDLPVVVANDSHYVDEQDQVVHEAHIALGQKGRTISSPDRYHFSGHGHFFRTEAQMRAVRPDDETWQRGCDETVRIAARVDDDIFPETRLRVPRFPIPAWFTSGLEEGTFKRYTVPSSAADGTDPVTFSYFMHRVHAGALERWGADLPSEVSSRIKFEMSVICRLGVMDYFLLVADLIAWARSDWTAEDWVSRHDTDTTPDHRQAKEPISVGPGRGSAPGSAVSYSLKIVGVDPIANGLLFERFLDLERFEMPDIDVDFEKERRSEVIHYLSVRYGHDNVCRLGMHGTNKMKRALDSAGRYLEISVNQVAEVKKQLPQDGADLSMLMDTDPPDTSSLSEKDAEALLERHASGDTLRRYLATADDEIRTMVEYAAVLEGVVVSPGMHACGVVVSDENLTPLVPMRLDKGDWVTEWDGPDVADFGLLKMDVLGLRTLDIVKATQRNVIAEQGDIEFDLDQLRTEGPRGDNTWDLLGRGDSTGVFQLESEGMRELLTTAHPRSLDDLSALIAAYRPGPMSAGMHTEWALRAGGKAPVSYSALSTDPDEQRTIGSVLGESQGVILFQEQMMRLGKIVGKFDAVRANNLRRAISKKKQKLIDSLKPDFIAGAQRAGVGEDGTTPVPAFSSETAERLWTAFEGSGSYAFNKSHTTAYGVLSYQTAYLKANWPPEFGAAALRFTGSGKDKAHLRVGTIRSLRAEGVEVMAPDINASDESTVARDGKVWIGLGEIKGVGTIAASVVDERTRNGPFTSMGDLASRVSVTSTDSDGKEATKSLTSAQLSALAHAGAFDSFGDGFRLGHVIAARAVRKDPQVRIPQMEYSVLEKATRQREVILAITGTHPTKTLARQIGALYQRPAGSDAAPKPPLGLHRLPSSDGSRIHTVGVVSAFTERRTRKGSWMVTMELENSHTSIQAVGFSDVHAALKEIGMPAVGDLVEIRGQVRVREVEREVIDEETGESRTQVSTERSIILSDVEYMDVEDPDRDAEGDPELSVGQLLADGTDLPRQMPSADQEPTQPVREDAAPTVPSAGEDEEDFEPMSAPSPSPDTGEQSADTAPSQIAVRDPAAKSQRNTSTAAGPSSTESTDADLETVSESEQWARLHDALQLATGEDFTIARPRRNSMTGNDVGTFLRVETLHGAALVPVSAQRRLSNLAAAGRLPAVISSDKLRCVVIDTRHWSTHLRAMTDAVNSGFIDPSATSVDGVEPAAVRTA